MFMKRKSARARFQRIYDEGPRSVLGVCLLCLLAQAGNLLFSLFFQDVLRLPLFLDTVFTVAVTFYAGLLPGLVLAASYNFIRLFLNALLTGQAVFLTEGLYSLCGMAIVLITWLFSRRKEDFRLSWQITVLYLLLIALLTALASSVIGGLVETFNRINFSGKSYYAPVESFVRTFLGEDMGLFVSCTLARIPVSMLDRLCASFAGYGIYLQLRWWGRAHERDA